MKDKELERINRLIKHELTYTLSQEALLSNLVPDFLSRFQSSLSSSIKPLENTINKRISKLFEKRSELDVFKEELKQTRFIDIQNIEVATPQGLTGNYAEYGEALKESIFFLNTFYPLMQVTEKLISIAITNPNKITDLELLQIKKEILHKEEEVEKFYKRISEFFKEGSQDSGKQIKKVFVNNENIISFVKVRDELNELYSKANVNSFLKEVRSLDNLSETLIKSIKATKPFVKEERYSQNLIKTLAECLMSMGNVVQFYSVTTYQVIQYLERSEIAVKKIKGFKEVN